MGEWQRGSENGCAIGISYFYGCMPHGTAGCVVRCGGLLNAHKTDACAEATISCLIEVLYKADNILKDI